MLSQLLIILVICFALNLPIAFSLGVASSAALVLGGNIPLTMIPQRMVAGVNSFPLLAIPFFMIAGSLMEKGGISRRIVEFASCLVGHIKGGLAAVSVLGCMFFAALSGSTPATAAAIGSITIPEMKKRGYDESYAAAVVASSACLGVIIPPSITMVIFGVTANASIGKMLIGGIIPGIFLGSLLMTVNFIIARKQNYATENKVSLKKVLASFADSILALLMPIIILGGIMTGIFTPTESAAIAVIYGLLIGFFYYKELKLKDMIPIFYKASLNSAMIMLLISVANPFGWIMTAQQAPQMIANTILSISNSPGVIYAIMIILYLILGTFMETAAIILLVVPILTPIVTQLNIDLVHFGVVTTAALAVGMATPPVGISLFATCSIADISLGEISRQVIPFLLILVFGIFVLAYFPQMVLFLPELVMGK